MTFVYIAGPMRGIPEFGFPAFDSAEDWLIHEHGFTVFNPARRDRDMGFDAAGLTGHEEADPAEPWSIRNALAADLAWITSFADMIVCLPGWENSKGACAEVATAIAIGIIVMPYSDFTGEPEPEAPTTGEVRVTDPNTGGQKGDKLARFDLIPAEALWQVAELYGAGARKYADRNWERGYAWHLSYAALLRHLNLFWMGETHDAETDCHHLASAVFHAFALMTFGNTHPELDDRPPRAEWVNA